MQTKRFGLCAALSAAALLLLAEIARVLPGSIARGRGKKDTEKAE